MDNTENNVIYLPLTKETARAERKRLYRERKEANLEWDLSVLAAVSALLLATAGFWALLGYFAWKVVSL